MWLMTAIYFLVWVFLYFSELCREIPNYVFGPRCALLLLIPCTFWSLAIVQQSPLHAKDCFNSRKTEYTKYVHNRWDGKEMRASPKYKLHQWFLQLISSIGHRLPYAGELLARVCSQVRTARLQLQPIFVWCPTVWIP